MSSYEKRTWWSRHRLTERLADATFLEAVVTCAFLVAAADGSQSDTEYDALLDRLEILGGVDRDKIDELLTAASNDVEANGFEPRLAALADMVKTPDAAEAVLMVGIAIALADDDFASEERDVATQIAMTLGLGKVDLDGLVAEIRG